MILQEIRQISIIGAGTMGRGIAQIAALAGFDVVLFDIDTENLRSSTKIINELIEKGVELGKTDPQVATKALSSLSTTSKFDDIKGDFIIEAAIEDLNVKKEIFTKLEQQVSPEVILATNTSSIPLTKIAAGMEHPDRVVGMHFFNPAYIMKLVEVISGLSTSAKTLEITKAIAEKMGKIAVLAKDSPGFIVNRVARHYYVESLKILEEGVANHEEIDGLLENCGFKMGPFRLMDLIGVDTNFAVTKSIYEAFNHEGKFRPARTQQQMVDAGRLGKKCGEGFYKY